MLCAAESGIIFDETLYRLRDGLLLQSTTTVNDNDLLHHTSSSSSSSLFALQTWNRFLDTTDADISETKNQSPSPSLSYSLSLDIIGSPYYSAWIWRGGHLGHLLVANDSSSSPSSSPLSSTHSISMFRQRCDRILVGNSDSYSDSDSDTLVGNGIDIIELLLEYGIQVTSPSLAIHAVAVAVAVNEYGNNVYPVANFRRNVIRFATTREILLSNEIL